MRVSLYRKLIMRDYKIFIVAEMLVEKMQYKITPIAVIGRVHSHLAEKVFHPGSLYHQSPETVPEIVQREQGFCPGLFPLIFRRDERTSQLYSMSKAVYGIGFPIFIL